MSADEGMPIQPQGITTTGSVPERTYMQAEVDALLAEARLEEFLLIKKERPIDPIYWDLHHETELRTAAGKGKI
jgi:hypothetical protein